eukprot:7153151-Ditylum_brightwellii.AAC.1
MKKRLQLKRKDFATANWEESGGVFRSRDFYHRRFITQYTYKCLPVKREKYSARADKTCPCCKKENEYFSHFIHCTENKEAWLVLLDVLLGVYEETKLTQ